MRHYPAQWNRIRIAWKFPCTCLNWFWMVDTVCIRKWVLHGNFYVPVLIKNVWYCFVYASKYYMYMENSMDLFNGQRCLKLFFLTRKWVLHGNFHVPVQFCLTMIDNVKYTWMSITWKFPLPFCVAQLYWNHKYCWQVFFSEK